MEFKKKTLSCTIISAVLAFSLCITAAAAGTAVINKTGNKDRKEKQYSAIKKFISEGKVVFDDGDYHILYGGVDEKDMSTGGCSAGCIGIVLDEPDGYVGIGPINLKELDTIVDEVSASCKRYLKNKRITQKKADLMIGLARLLKDKNGKVDGIKDISISKEYKKWKITTKNGNFYYKKKRVRILADLRADKSLVQFTYDEKGVIDLKITRNKKGNISKIGYLSKKETEEFLEDWM